MTNLLESRTRTEITFDFHRLNVLLLRAIMQDSHLVGQKIATATMSDARIQATLATTTSILGSLGGLQVLDQTLIGKTHQRIISVGRDPIADPPNAPLEHFSMSDQPEAFRFSATRSTSPSETVADISIRVGSVWYTHAPHLISELRSCADEFKQYLSNLARHIGAAATDMAIGLVHAEDWTAPQRRRLPSVSLDGNEAPSILRLKLDVVLDSPVLVIPRSSHSTQVFVAHLGTMSLQHEPSTETTAKHKLTLEVRDMNLYSLDVSCKVNQATSLPIRAEEMYSCRESGKPILHDTMIKVTIEREIKNFEARDVLLEHETSENPILQVHGIVITPLRVSLSRSQYEQLLDTIHRLFSMPHTQPVPAETQNPDNNDTYYSDKFDLSVKVLFELPTLSVELKQDRSEQPLVELSMCDFVAKYEKLQKCESTTQVALRSLLIEDLLCPVGSRHRYMMQSSAPTRARLPIGVSKSCPDLTLDRRWRTGEPSVRRGSLPDRLEAYTLYGTIPAHWRKPVSMVDTPNTPPPSPGAVTSEENLVLLSFTMTELDRTPEGRAVFKKSVSIDFNCLDLVISVESWMIVLDFFGIGAPTANPQIALHATSTSNDQEEMDKAIIHSETDIEVRSLTLVLTQSDREIAKANVSNASMHILKDSSRTKVSGSLGSMSLLDLTPHGRFYRERFSSSGRKALNFQYSSYADSRKMLYDAQLKLHMSSVHYVHTQRFVAELQAFFRHFSQLRAMMANLRTDGTAVIDVNRRNTRLSLELHAGAPVILLPVSSRSDELILLDLGELTASNSFGESAVEKECLLDTMLLDLVNMDVYAARRLKYEDQRDNIDTLQVGGFHLQKLGPSLLTEMCHLKLRIERNLDTYISRNIPDLSVHGTLSTMNCALDPAQYMLIRGLLSYNIGENLEDIRVFMQDLTDAAEYNVPPEDTSVWTRSCIILDIVNVTLKLHPNHGIAALACVNFIKSRLTLDSLSDGSQDIDLVSQEILVTDTRFQDEPVNKRSNVFTNILQPLKNFGGIDDRVQAEVHHRRRKNNAATTILLHSMRLTGILDWWEAVRDFLVLNAPEPEPVSGIASALVVQGNEKAPVPDTNATPFELKLNITDSELVIVEDTSLWDTNAVILKCTAILSYRSVPMEGEKPLSCNLSHCELFSCILGMEEETALSIIDPVGASLELTNDRCLEIQLQPLSVKLSYHDVTMFTRMLKSLPKQTLWAKQRSQGPPANAKSHVMKLSALGFAETDCEAALDRCNGQLDDAALWLTQNAVPNAENAAKNGGVMFHVVEITTTCLRVCIIDDCRDADVPLAELMLIDLSLGQALDGPGSVRGTFGVDYYNRVLSGWEPFIEPWKASIEWQEMMTNSLSSKRVQISVDSEDSVNVNVTSTLVELVQLVKQNWTQDYYLANKETSFKTPLCVQGYRRRSPFVPFALKNETGSKLWFKTYISVADDVREISMQSEAVSVLHRDETWSEVSPGDTVPFTFEGRGKLRHHSTHTVRRHQVAVLVEGWKPVEPVTIDRVGIYFRHAIADFVDTQVRWVTPRRNAEAWLSFFFMFSDDGCENSASLRRGSRRLRQKTGNN